MLTFSDGEKFDLSGKMRIERRKDGYYILGNNMMSAVDSYSDGIEAIRRLQPDADIVKRYDQQEAERKAQFFCVGRRYRIVKEGGRIAGWTSVGPWTERSWNHECKIGDIVTYVGHQYSGGSDGIDCMAFSAKADGHEHRGIFWPNDWGTVSEDFFEIVD